MTTSATLTAPGRPLIVDEHGRPPRELLRWAGLPAAGAVVGAGVFLLTFRSLVDDAYITLTYARTLGLHGQWGMVEGLTSNTATSPLNVMVLGAVTAVTRDAVAAAGVVLMALFALAAGWLRTVGGQLGLPGWRLPAVGVGGLATMPLLVSTVGLESYLALVLIIGLARFAGTRGWWAVGVVAGLLTLTRPDLVVFGVVAVVLAGRSSWRVAVAASATALPWFAGSWILLGSAVPDSLLLKVGATWGRWTFANGLALHFHWFPTALALSVIPAVVGVLALPWWLRRGPRRPLGALWGCGALAHFAAFCLLNTAPFHWYYAPSLGSLGLLAAATAAQHRVALAGAALLVAVSAYAISNDGVPRERAPISVNWASAAQYEAIAATLPAGATVRSPGEIGTLAYYCRCRVVDSFADRGYLPPLIAQREAAAGPVTRALLAANYRRFPDVTPQRLDYVIETSAVPAGPGVPMQGSWGDGRVFRVVPAR